MLNQNVHHFQIPYFYLYKDEVIEIDDYFSMNMVILRLFRNLATHLYSAAGAEVGVGRNRVINISDIWIDAPIIKLFELELIDFQFALFKRNTIGYFMI